MKTITIMSTWINKVIVEIPDDINPHDVFNDINNGCLPEWAADQVTTYGANLIDWSADY